MRKFKACIIMLLTAASVLGSSWTFEGGARTVLDPGSSLSLQRGAFSSLAWPPATSGAASFSDEKRGILWMFGGYTKFKFGGHIFKGASNMLWAYDTSRRAWAWFGGGVLLERSDDEPSALPGPLPWVLTTTSRTEAQDSGAGLGSNSASMRGGPGPRYSSVTWWDGEGRRWWLFGGVGRGGVSQPLGDMWSLDVDSMMAQAAALGRCAQNAPCYSTAASAWARHSLHGAGAGDGVAGTTDRATPMPRRLAAGWVVQGHLLLFGGYGGRAWLNDMWSFDTARLQWRPLGGRGTSNGRGNATWPAARTSPTTWRSRCHDSSNLRLDGGHGGHGAAGAAHVLWMRGGYAGFASIEGWLADLWACVIVVTGGNTGALAIHWRRVRGDLKSDLPVLLNSPNHEDDPGSRDRSLSWTQLLPTAKVATSTTNSGAECARLWLFGGSGFDGGGRFAYKSDVWWFGAPCSCSALTTPGHHRHDAVKWHLASASHKHGIYRRSSKGQEGGQKGAYPGARYGSAAWSTLEPVATPPRSPRGQGGRAQRQRVRFYIFGGHGDDARVPKPEFDRLSDLWSYTVGTFVYPERMIRSWQRGGDGGSSSASGGGGARGTISMGTLLLLACAGVFVLRHAGVRMPPNSANRSAQGVNNADTARAGVDTEVELLGGVGSDKSTVPDTGIGVGVTAYQYQAPATDDG